MKKNCFFIGLVVLLLLAACQSTKTPEVDTDLSVIEATLKARLENYMFATALEKPESIQPSGMNIVYMVDPKTGYAYSNLSGLTSFNVYTESADGVMRNQVGEALRVPVVKQFRESEIASLQFAPDQGPPKPYRYVTTLTSNWRQISSKVDLGVVNGVDKLGQEAAYAFFGLRWANNAYNADIGLYSAPWHDTNKDGHGDYWGVFASVGDDNDPTTPPRWLDFSSTNSPPWNQPYNPPSDGTYYYPTIPPPLIFLTGGFTNNAMSLRVWGEIKCVASPKLKVNGKPYCEQAYFPKSQNQGYIEHKIYGDMFLQYQGEAREKCDNCTVTYIYPANGLTFTGGGQCPNTKYMLNAQEVYLNNDGITDACLKMTSPQGWSFYRETSLLAVDSADMGAEWKDTALYKGNWSAPAHTHYGNFGYRDSYAQAFLQSEKMTTANAKDDMTNNGETPFMFCPWENQRAVTDPLNPGSEYNKDYSWTGKIGTITKIWKWNVHIYCGFTKYTYDLVSIQVKQR